MDRHEDIQPTTINLAPHDIDITRSDLQLLGPCFLITFHTNPYPKILEEMLVSVGFDQLIAFHVHQNRYQRSIASSGDEHGFFGINLHLMGTTKLSYPACIQNSLTQACIRAI